MQVLNVLKINEIFYSIQGEGHNTGMPCVFIRFSGCNTNCHWCDTKYHKYFTILSIKEILERVAQYPCRNVIFTGGEPTIQPYQVLLNDLKTERYWVGVETNGTKHLGAGFDWITVSPKVNVKQERGNELKVIFEGRNVEEFFDRLPDFDHYYLQPLSMSNIQETVEYVLNHPRWNLSLQCQKLIGLR